MTSQIALPSRASVLGKIIRSKAVVKIGSSVLTNEEGRLDPRVVRRLASEVAPLASPKRWPSLVSSGAIAVGMGILGLKQRPRAMAGLQSAAAVGQSRLVETWSQAFRRYNLPVAQVLLTHSDLADRTRFLNARRALMELERRRAIPVINENDSVSFEEIAFGDNDALASLVTNLVDAPLLVMLSSAPGVLDQGGKRISMVRASDPSLDGMIRPERSAAGTGGMKSKLQASRAACARGAVVAILPGKEQGILSKFFAGNDVGTMLLPQDAPLRSRAHWIATALRPCGFLTVDDGAEQALLKNKSLLDRGLVSIDGDFQPGEAVDIVGPNGLLARGLIRVSADQLRGHRRGRKAPIVHRDDLVLLARLQ